MKKVILSLVVVILAITTSYGQSETTESFGVRGNCGMCKGTIEKAAMSIDGVSSAVWDSENKKFELSFDANKTDLKAIHNAIATNLVKANDKSYNGLHGCCQYDREMKLSSVKATIK